MGSKKLKRKKLKLKKLYKFRKLNLIKQEEGVSLRSCNESDCEKNVHEKNIVNRLNQKNYPHYCADQEDVSNIKYFSKIREDYFRYLQMVVSDNCLFYDSVVTEEMLENLALELEQNALLACLQVDIYKKSMIKIIGDIKKCTEEKQVHEDVRKLLPGTLEEQLPDVNSTKVRLSFPLPETYNKIPTIAGTRIDDDDDVAGSRGHWEDLSNYNSDPYYSITEQEYNENQVDTHSHDWIGNETFSNIPDPSNYWVNNATQTNDCNINVFENPKCTENQPSVVQNNCNDSTIEVCSPAFPPSISNEKLDPLLISRNQLQKLVEQTLNETEKINRQRRDEQEKAYIAQILEGEDSLDDRLNDSLSDNENESKENIDESNLMDRLEKMREIFGMEEESHIDVVPEKQKESNKVNHVNNRIRRPTIWRYEKFIQLHKYSIIAAEMSFERRQDNRRLFFELFGEDSDEEHETEYSSPEKFRSSCTERISSWVVKYLMPFYHEKRILGRNVFKSLGHFVSDSIVDKIQYPDEWTVKYMVSKFFPPKKKYICEADVLNFQLD